MTVIFRNASPFALVPGGKPSVLFAEIVGDLTCDRCCLFNRPWKVRDAARFSGEALEQPCVFLFLRHSVPESDGIDDRVGPARKHQHLRIRLAARVVAAVADDDERPLLRASELEVPQAFGHTVVAPCACSADGGQRDCQLIRIMLKGSRASASEASSWKFTPNSSSSGPLDSRSEDSAVPSARVFGRML